MGDSVLCLQARLYMEYPWAELELFLHWRERQRIARLIIPLSKPVSERLDGVPGGSIIRKQDGREYPLEDHINIEWKKSIPLGIVCPDVWSVSGKDQKISLTLCRLPVYAWHDPMKLKAGGHYRWTDQGEHFYRFVLSSGIGSESLKIKAAELHQPPMCYDWTDGMAL